MDWIVLACRGWTRACSETQRGNARDQSRAQLTQVGAMGVQGLWAGLPLRCEPLLRCWLDPALRWTTCVRLLTPSRCCAVLQLVLRRIRGGVL